MIACNITDGNMPHGANSSYDSVFPNVNHDEEDNFIAEVTDGTLIGFKYFEFHSEKRVGLTYRGAGGGSFFLSFDEGKTYFDEVEAEGGKAWHTVFFDKTVLEGVYSLYIIYKGSGCMDVCSVRFL